MSDVAHIALMLGMGIVLLTVPLAFAGMLAAIIVHHKVTHAATNVPAEGAADRRILRRAAVDARHALRNGEALT